MRGQVGFVDCALGGHNCAAAMHAKGISARGSHGPADHLASVFLINDVIFEQRGYLNIIYLECWEELNRSR